ncbi:aldose epimerase family protein [Nocardia callitridis]|uniref:Aldose 1-epimerase n=1 Tax=Nocardia callitridis TaxID=648753 RepID=A0ABP9K5J1_9NOCA
MGNLELRAGDAHLTVSQDRGSVTGFRLGDRQVLSGEHELFPMAPWCGRMRDGVLEWEGGEYRFPRTSGPHAIHGTVRNRPWQVLAHSATNIVLAQELSDPWPFEGRVTQSITLGTSVAFTMTVAASSAPFPAQVGWHPWFARRINDVAAEIRFDPAWQLERGEDYLPTGRRITPSEGPWDDCFGMPDGVRVGLVWPQELAMTVTSPLHWAVVFDQPADAICVEPQSGPPDGLNTTPRVVTPDNPLMGEMAWDWEVLADTARRE